MLIDEHANKTWKLERFKKQNFIFFESKNFLFRGIQWKIQILLLKKLFNAEQLSFIVITEDYSL